MQKIKFKRGSNVFTGKVVKTNENSVIVEVSATVQKKLDIATNLTVVNFKNITEGPGIKALKALRENG